MKLFLVLAATLAVASTGTIDPALELAVQSGATQAILELPQIIDQIHSNQALQSLHSDAKVTALVSTLQGLTSAAQAPFVSIATSLDLETKQYWASNIILVKGLTPEKLSTLSSTPGDFTIRAQNVVSLNPHPAQFEFPNTTQNNPQWGVAKIRAPEAWAVADGAGVVAAIIDSGVNLGHVALAPGYAGAWFDPYYATADPTDENGHGSHCAGSVLGRANGVGVAPGARWVACRGVNHQGIGTEGPLTECAQFFLTSNPRPHVISNSWGGGAGQTWFNPQNAAWRNAGIIPVFAIGNSGSACGTASSPADQPDLIAVGASTDTDATATYSSRGPSISGPDVCAPGTKSFPAGQVQIIMSPLPERQW